MTLVGGGAQSELPTAKLGHPRVHFRRIDSTNDRARQLAIAGAPHGAAVTAAEQSAGRGRQGRTWVAPPSSALLCSLVLRDPPPLLSLIAGVAVCDVVGKDARVKWPNDLVVGRDLAKLAGILVEGRPQEGWAVLGVGLNVAVHIEDLPAELRGRAASLELEANAIEPLFEQLLETLLQRLTEPIANVLDAWRARDALLGREVSWALLPTSTYPQDTRRPARGRAESIDDEGRLLVSLADGTTTTLEAGEVHLWRSH
jgi:BirA family biotin operon repressor/biotin-[acetyl-CoA-carboxylase] ligase